MLNKQKEGVKKLLRSKYFYFGLVILIIGSFLNQTSSYYIFTNFPNLPTAPDLILGKIPQIDCFCYFYDIFAIMSILLFIGYAVYSRLEETPYFLMLFGILQLIRAFFIVLTPLAVPNAGIYGILNSISFQYGVYPSGHTGATFLAFLLARGRIKIIFLLLSLLVIISLLFGGGHYSIDIFSAIIFAYAVYAFGKLHLTKFKLAPQE